MSSKEKESKKTKNSEKVNAFHYENRHVIQVCKILHKKIIITTNKAFENLYTKGVLDFEQLEKSLNYITETLEFMIIEQLPILENIDNEIIDHVFDVPSAEKEIYEFGDKEQ